MTDDSRLTDVTRSRPTRGYIWCFFAYASGRIVSHRRKTRHHTGPSYRPAESESAEEARATVKNFAADKREESRALKALETLETGDGDEADERQPASVMELKSADKYTSPTVFSAMRHETPCVAQTIFGTARAAWIIELHEDDSATVWRKANSAERFEKIREADSLNDLDEATGLHFPSLRRATHAMREATSYWAYGPVDA